MTIPASLVHLVGSVLLHFVWQGTAIALALGFALLLAPKRWARARYLLACVALAAMAAAPLGTLARFSTEDAVRPAVQGAFDAPGTTPLMAAVSVTDRIPAPASRAFDAAIAPGLDWLPWFVAAWAFGVLVSAARLAGGWAQARRLLHEDAFPADDLWSDAVARLSARLGLGRTVRLLESARVQVPVVIGALRPVLLLPASAMTGLAPAQVEAVLAHELAHIRRHDYLVNLLQSAVETLLFYHPAVWWVSHAIRVEREHCCDDLAVAACGDALLYARALTAIETMRQGHAGIALAASDGSLLARVRRLLGVSQPQPLASSGWVVAAATVLLVAGAGLASYARDLALLLPDVASAARESGAPQSGNAPAAAQGQLPATPAPPAEPATPSLPPGDEAEGGTPSAPDAIGPAEAQVPQHIDEAVSRALVEVDRAMKDQPRGDTRVRWHVDEQVARAMEQVSEQLERSQVDRAQVDAAVRDALREAERVMRDPKLRESRERALAEAGRMLSAHRAEIDRAVAEAGREVARTIEAHRGDIDRAVAEASRNIDAGREVAKSLEAQRPEIERAVAEASRVVAEVLDAHRDEIGRALEEAARSLAIAGGRLERGRQAPPAPPAPPTPPAPPAPPASTPPPPAAAPPAPPAAPAPPAPPPPGVSHLGSRGGTWTMSSTRDGTSLKIQAKGRLELNDDDTDVRSLEKGGFFIFETGGSWVPWTYASRFEARSKADGTIERTWSIKGRAVGEADGRAWVAAELPRIAREFAIGADARVRRLLARGGPQTVLADISRTSSAFAKRACFTELFAQAQLDSTTLAASLRQAGKEIASDFELSTVLRAAADRFPLDAVSAPAYAEAAAKIESDFEMRGALAEALRQPGLGAAQAALLVRAAVPGHGGGIDSDFEQASLLLEVPPALVDGIGPLYFEAVASLGSDFERRRVLGSLAARRGLPQPTLLAAINATRGMGSDFERAEALLAIAASQRLDGAAKDAALDAALGIGSDHERGRVLSVLTRTTTASR